MRKGAFINLLSKKQAMHNLTALRNKSCKNLSNTLELRKLRRPAYFFVHFVMLPNSLFLAREFFFVHFKITLS